MSWKGLGRCSALETPSVAQFRSEVTVPRWDRSLADVEGDTEDILIKKRGQKPLKHNETQEDQSNILYTPVNLLYKSL